MKSKLPLTKPDLTVFDTTQRDVASHGPSRGSGVKVPAVRPGSEGAHGGSQHHTYPLSCSFHFDDFGCQVEPSRYFRALVNLPKTPAVEPRKRWETGLRRLTVETLRKTILIVD